MNQVPYYAPVPLQGMGPQYPQQVVFVPYVMASTAPYPVNSVPTFQYPANCVSTGYNAVPQVVASGGQVRQPQTFVSSHSITETPSKKAPITIINPKTNAEVNFDDDLVKRRLQGPLTFDLDTDATTIIRENFKKMVCAGLNEIEDNSHLSTPVATTMASPVCTSTGTPMEITMAPISISTPSSIETACMNCKLDIGVQDGNQLNKVIPPMPTEMEKPEFIKTTTGTGHMYDRATLISIGRAVSELPQSCPISVKKGLTEPTSNVKPYRKKFPGRYQGYRRGYDKVNTTPDSAKAEAALDTPSDTAPVEVVLRKSANAWKPKRRGDAEGASEENEFEKQKREVRGILNKITPTTFEELVTKFCELELYKNDKLLSNAVDIIFDKAVDEPKYCSMYSTLCLKKAKYEESKTSEEKKKSSMVFRYALIRKCQSQFENKNVDVENLTAKIKDASIEDKPALEEELNKLERKNKRHFLGTIRFISHLYRTSLLNIPIIAHCVVLLLKCYQEEKDELCIEYIVQLYETIGPTYESERHRYYDNLRSTKVTPWCRDKPAIEESRSEDPVLNVEKVYAYLCAQKHNFSLRVRFMVMNMEDMRRNNWTERRIDQGPKTLDELQREIETEQLLNEQAREDYHNRKMERNFERGMPPKFNRPPATMTSVFNRNQNHTAVDTDKDKKVSKDSNNIMKQPGLLSKAMKTESKLSRQSTWKHNK